MANIEFEIRLDTDLKRVWKLSQFDWNRVWNREFMRRLSKHIYLIYIHAVAHALIHLYIFFSSSLSYLSITIVHCAIIPLSQQKPSDLFLRFYMMMGFVDVMISLCNKRKEGSCAKRMCHQLTYIYKRIIWTRIFFISFVCLFCFVYSIQRSIRDLIATYICILILFIFILLTHNLDIVVRTRTSILECVSTRPIWLHTEWGVFRLRFMHSEMFVW